MYNFETNLNRFLESESPNSDLNHAFLSSIEAEIISLLPKKLAIILFCWPLRPSYKHFNVTPLPELIVRP